MKKYVYFLAVALVAMQFQSCSSGDDNLASPDEFQPSVLLPTLTRGEILDGIKNSQIYGGGNTEPKEKEPFYMESIPEVDWVAALGTFSTVDQDRKVEVHDNLGGGVYTKDGGSFSMSIKGNGLHIEGSVTTHPQSGITYHSRVSLDIDDTRLLASNSATITKFNLSTDTEVTVSEETITGSAYLAAINIPMTSNIEILASWKGGTIIDYSWSSGYSSLNLVDSPANFIEVWIAFKNGSSAKARIELRRDGSCVP